MYCIIRYCFKTLQLMKVLNKSVERVNTGKVELQDLTLLKPALIPNKRVVMAAVHLKFNNLSRRTVQLLTALWTADSWPEAYFRTSRVTLTNCFRGRTANRQFYLETFLCETSVVLRDVIIGFIRVFDIHTFLSVWLVLQY